MMVKGADHIVIERSTSCQGFTFDDLRNNLYDYSSVGLRTLVLAYKVLSKEQAQSILEQITSIDRVMGHDKEIKVRTC